MRPKFEGITRRIVPVAIALLLLVAASATAETKVLTIYFHGTGSGLTVTPIWPGATAEFYVRDSAHDFSKTWVLLPCGGGWTHLVMAVQTEGGHPRYKYTVDGFGTPGCLSEAIDPRYSLRNWDVATGEGMMAIREAMAKNPGATWILNLVGHSRGGVLTMTVAHAAASSDVAAAIEKINILAYDPVPGSADPIRWLGPSFKLSPKVRQYVGVYAKHHMQWPFEPIVPKASDPSSTGLWTPLLPGSHTDLVGALLHDDDIEAVGLAIGEQLLTSPNWGEVALPPMSAISDEDDFRSFVTRISARDYTWTLNNPGIPPGFSWILPCHESGVMIRANSALLVRTLPSRLTFVAEERHDGHLPPWWCGFWWINEERVFWLKDYAFELTGDDWRTLRDLRGVSVPADTEAPTREPLPTLESVCPMTISVPMARDNSGTIAGTTTHELTISTGGTHVIKWTFADPSNNVLTLEQTVVVTPENDPPDLDVPADITRSLSASAGTPYLTLSSDDLGSAIAGDACAVTVEVTGVPVGNNFPLGTTTLMYTATDAWGNATSAEQNVTITVDPPANVTTGTDAASCAALVSETLLTIPPIPGVTIQRSVPANYAFPVGTTTVTYTLTDQAGHTTTAEQTVTVHDGTPPRIVPPAALEIAAGGESCTAPWTVEATDHCGPVTVVTNPPSPYPLGTTTVNVTATDDAGNVTTQSFPVTVVDVTAPSLTVPSSLVVEATASDCAPAVTWDPPTASDCGAVTVVSNPPSGSKFALGTTTVNVTATDGSGNKTSGSFEVTVLDKTPPLLAALPDISLPAEAGHCDAAVTWAVIATDSCGAVDVVSTPPPGRFPVGTTKVVVTATDGSGNSTSQAFNVTVVDAEEPSITGASANPPVLGAPNHKLVDVAIAYATGDNCGTATCSLSVSSNEPETGTGDEDFAPDWEIVGPNLVRLRAERAGWGSGRIYTITISCADAAGNVATRAVTVQVPKSKK